MLCSRLQASAAPEDLGPVGKPLWYSLAWESHYGTVLHETILSDTMFGLKTSLLLQTSTHSSHVC